jgi:hypothetical protein
LGKTKENLIVVILKVTHFHAEVESSRNYTQNSELILQSTAVYYSGTVEEAIVGIASL